MQRDLWSTIAEEDGHFEAYIQCEDVFTYGHLYNLQRPNSTEGVRPQGTAAEAFWDDTSAATSSSHEQGSEGSVSMLEQIREWLTDSSARRDLLEVVEDEATAESSLRNPARPAGSARLRGEGELAEEAGRAEGTNTLLHTRVRGDGELMEDMLGRRKLLVDTQAARTVTYKDKMEDFLDPGDRCTRTCDGKSLRLHGWWPCR